VSRPASEARARVGALAALTAELLDVAHDPEAFAASVDVRDGALGAGYGIPSPAGTAALELAARREGILLDPTYTAKAFAGHLAAVAARPPGTATRTVFLHTGGQPALFAPAAGDVLAGVTGGTQTGAGRGATGA
jgi:1-aminocyclopropane-1-carboxylate deaminase/D-cysteine desulfhydrase-like pyridoxal-dependent ACC family enzyme